MRLLTGIRSKNLFRRSSQAIKINVELISVLNDDVRRLAALNKINVHERDRLIRRLAALLTDYMRYDGDVTRLSAYI